MNQLLIGLFAMLMALSLFHFDGEKQNFKAQSCTLPCVYKAGDTITRQEFENSDFFFGELITEFTYYKPKDGTISYKPFNYKVFEANHLGYQIVCNNVIEHSNLTAHEAIREISYIPNQIGIN